MQKPVTKDSRQGAGKQGTMMLWRTLTIMLITLWLADLATSHVRGAEPGKFPAASTGDLAPLSTEADLTSLKGPSLTPPAKTSPRAKVEGSASTKAAHDGQAPSQESQLALARLMERRGESQQAEQILHALQAKSPHDPRPYHRLAVIAVRKNDFAQAEKLFQTAQSLGPPTADLLSDLGYCYYLQQRLPEAKAVLNQALQLESNHASATNNLALAVGAEGRFDESLSLFKRVNKEAQAYANLAYVLAQYGDLVRSQQVYERALTLDNSMREAAKAMLQVAKRKQVLARLAAQKAGQCRARDAGQRDGVELARGAGRSAGGNRRLGTGGEAMNFLPPRLKRDRSCEIVVC